MQTMKDIFFSKLAISAKEFILPARPNLSLRRSWVNLLTGEICSCQFLS